MTTIAFGGTVIDAQSYLDGTREFTIDGESVPPTTDHWQITLTFRWPKESGAELVEGDLTLSDPAGNELYAALRGGEAESTVDPDTDEERVEINLRFEIASGDGAWAERGGAVRVWGALAGEEARLSAEIAFEDGAAEA